MFIIIIMYIYIYIYYMHANYLKVRQTCHKAQDLTNCACSLQSSNTVTG